MGRPRTLPDADELHRLLVVKGVPQIEVARQYNVTRAAVSYAVRRLNIPVQPRISYADYIPWTVKTEHNTAFPLRMLRLYARRQMELPNAEKDNGYLDKFLARLREMDGVVAYDSAREEGFFYAPARDVDRPGVIRKPDWILEREAKERKPSRKRASRGRAS